MITLEKAAKYYNGTCAFRIPQLTIEDGQIVGLLGENGAGKTSLLKVLAGVTDHDGTVLIDGQPPRKIYDQMAFITEEGSWFGFMNAMQFGEFLQDFFPGFLTKRYQSLLDFFELPRDRAIRSFSKGQQAKIEIAAGFSKGARYIFMDEPFLGKDIFTRRDFLKLMASSLHGEETILISTHQVEEIEHFLDRAIILHQGSLVSDQTLDEIHAAGQNLVERMQEATGYDPERYQKFEF
ncbi:ATP-binding cassette domain-containing protein [Intestinibacillus sp. Marseille-P6563]|uniref:ATP-binding cassette domain-containing protein n=1 Tax=Intestinibacillus sp. Marseille-P6563 TaxID=2364792 RepID=UPI000F06C0BE|nr:ABC transporter ATP-binding protein [Intestinibacillus sp. Marseille-P6563]